MEKPEQQFNFEQACNYLEEKKETLAEDTKKDAQQFDAITDVSPAGRKKFLLYGLSLVSTISPAAKRMMPKELLMGGSHSDKELIRSIKRYMILRIHGYSMLYISKYLRRHVKILLDMEKVAMVVIQESIEKTKRNGIPLMGNG